jgi:hypothetical protein
MSKNITMSEQFRNHVGDTTLSEQFRNHVAKYYTVRKVPKSCQKIPQSCIFLHMYVQGQESELSCICVLGVSVFADFTAWFRNCSDSLIFFYVISELFWQSGIFRYDFGAVLTVWYFLTWFRNCSDSVVFCWTVPKSCRKIPHCQNSSEIMSKNTTLSEQFRNHVEKYHTIRTVPK